MALLINAPDHPIESVTIYKSHRAEIVRRFSLQLVVGQNKIEIKSLPATIDTQSIRISGLGHAHLRDVVCLLNHRKRPGPNDYAERIEALRTKCSELEEEKAALQQRSRILADYSGTLKGEHVCPADLAAFLETHEAHTKKKIRESARLEALIKEVSKDILKEDDAASLRQGPKSIGELTVVIASDAEEKVDLKLTYIVNSVVWAPTYELHATTENGKPLSSVVLNYRALISQRTGEDWTNAKLTLSTSDTSMNTTIPKLPSIKIRPQPRRGSLFGPGSAHPTISSQRPKQPVAYPRATTSFFGAPAFGGASAFAQPSAAASGAALSPQSLFRTFGASSTTAPAGQAFGGQGAQPFGAAPTPLAFGQSLSGTAGQSPVPSSAASGPVISGQGLSFGNVGQASQVAAFGVASGPVAGQGLFSSIGQEAQVFGAALEPVPSRQGLFSNVDQQSTQQPIAAPEIAAVAESVRPPGAADPNDLLEEELAEQASGAVVRDSALSISYPVQGEAAIPSDGLAHMVSVAELQFNCQIKYVAVPRVESVVYLQCEVKNTSEYRLLSGTVGVIFDESFVSQTSILDVPAGDTFTCTLGVDPATKISYSRRVTHSDTNRSTFSEAHRSTTNTISVTIINKHGFALEDVLVKESLPMVDVSNFSADGSGNLSDNSKARVVLKKPLGLAEAKPGEVLSLDGEKVDVEGAEPVGTMMARWAEPEPGGQSGDKEGKFEWFGRLDQGEKLELEAVWDIKSVEDAQWKEVRE